MSKELTVRDNQGQGQLVEYSAADVVRQVAKIQEIMGSVMKVDEHYGVIPGCGDKPTLLKSGAEKLAFTFRLAPDFQVEVVDMGNGHREYQIITKITNSVTGDFLGSGVGSACTLETKWRYRTENTGKDVPKEYWDNRDPKLLGGTDYSARKQGNKWVIYHRVDHDNPADYYNTCLKMGKKRSLVDAILTATAASDLFSQDLEDLKSNGVIVDDEPASEPVIKKPKPVTKGSASKPKKEKPVPEEAKVVKQVADDGECIEIDELPNPVLKEGESAKGPWIKYAFTIDGTWYSTFDDGIHAAIDANVGERMVIGYTEDKYGRKITSICPVEAIVDEDEPVLDEPELTDPDDDDLPF